MHVCASPYINPETHGACGDPAVELWTGPSGLTTARCVRHAPDPEIAQSWMTNGWIRARLSEEPVFTDDARREDAAQRWSIDNDPTATAPVNDGALVLRLDKNLADDVLKPLVVAIGDRLIDKVRRGSTDTSPELTALETIRQWREYTDRNEPF